MKRLLYFLGILLCCFFQLHGQYDLRKIHRVNGLSNESINAIAQDHFGFIWVGTRDGLNRYDGYEVKSYSTDNSNLRANDISALLFDSHNRLWVGSFDGGVGLYDFATDSFNYFESPEEDELMESQDVRDIHEDQFGNIWVGTKHGLNKYNSETRSFINFNTPFSSNLIREITSDSSGNIWVGTHGGGLIGFNPKTEEFVAYLGDEDTPKPNIFCIVPLDGYELLIGTRDSGLLLFDSQTGLFEPFLPESHEFSKSKTIRSLHFSQNRLWIGTDGSGLFVLEKKANRWEVYSKLYNQTSPKAYGYSILKIFHDRNNNLWLGSAWQGLRILKWGWNEIRYLRDVSGVISAPVWSLYKENDRTWLGTQGNGLYIHEDSRSSSKNDQRKGGVSYLDGLSIVSIDKRRDGRFWIGTYSNGLILFDPKTGPVKRYALDKKKDNTLVSNDIRDVFQDGDHSYWIATWGGGLAHFDEKRNQFKIFEYESGNEQSLSNTNVIALEPKNNSLVWVATFGGGLNILNTHSKSVSRFRPNNGSYLSSNNLTCLYYDQKKYLWVGTWSNGLNRLDVETGQVEQFDRFEELKGVTICGILEDYFENTWLSTPKGIYKYDSKADTLVNFSDLDGRYHFGSVFKDEDGYFYFGGEDGVTIFHPADMRATPKQVEVVITDVKLFNKSITPGKENAMEVAAPMASQISLDYDESVLTFEFSGISYPSSANCEYLIYLEGFDEDWRSIGNKRSSTYTNLSPGEYVFRVKARENNGNFSRYESCMKVHVRKPLWATWWAYLMYVVIILALLYFYRRYSIHWEKMKSQLRLERMGREKEAELHEVKLRFFTNVSHEIRTPVTLILGAINRLIASGITEKTQHTAVETIKKNGTHLYNLVTELLDFRKLESGEASIKTAQGNMVKFAKEIYLSFVEYASSKKIDYSFSEPDKEVMVWYDRDEMEKVLYNLLSNAFKYTDIGGKVVVSVKEDEQAAYISIADSGKGIPSKQLSQIFKRFYQTDNKVQLKEQDDGFGLGLSIVYDIVKLHGGEILPESELGRGTTFTIKLLKGRGHLSPDFVIDQFEDSEQISQYQKPEEIGKKQEQPISFEDYSDMTVLVVEDNDSIREYLRNLLKEYFNVIEATNGMEAMELTFRELPDLVLSDVMMPEMDGITYASKIKNDPRTSHIPVIILTARTSLIYKKEGLDLGVDDYITKPFSETMLKTRVRNLLNNRKRLKEKYKTELLIEPSELAMRSPDQEFLSRISGLVEENMSSEELSADFLCKEMGMSQSNLYKKLKSLTGMSIVEFVRDFRLKYAAQLIVKQKYTVSEACMRVGFNDRSYFSQVFKAKYGVTPSRYGKD